ncbi:hypothetical protein AERO9AM_10318 [Aeromicrobium sp. 9AM]|nr:hypothetical protein AERO9AM_10318 [Aeromicrobium sp. 9AM]
MRYHSRISSGCVAVYPRLEQT